MISPVARTCLASNTLHLVLLPTEACNFRCTYCFEAFNHSRMKRGVVDGVKRLLARRAADLDLLTLSWFGGEPLLAFDLVEELLSHVRALRSLRPTLRFESDLTTNAFLLNRQRFERLLELGVKRYQVAFDGPQALHDRKRVLANGGATFDQIWSNLRGAREVAGDFSVIMRLHVDGENHASAPRFIEELAKDFGGDRRFKLFIRPLSRLGGPNDRNLPLLDPGGKKEIIRRLRRIADSLGVEQVAFEPSETICYAARANSYVIRADGRLNKCSLDLEEPRNHVGRIHEDGTLEVDRSRLMPWLRGIWEEEREVLGCPRRGMLNDEETGRAVTWRPPARAVAPEPARLRS